MLITEAGQMICIGASDLRVIGRNTQGVKLFDLKENDHWFRQPFLIQRK